MKFVIREVPLRGAFDKAHAAASVEDAEVFFGPFFLADTGGRFSHRDDSFSGSEAEEED